MTRPERSVALDRLNAAEVAARAFAPRYLPGERWDDWDLPDVDEEES